MRPVLRDMPSHSRGGFHPGYACWFRPKEGVGNAGCPVHPLVVGMHTSIHSEFTGNARHSRTQWFYGLYRALPGDRAFLPPSPADRSTDLTPASGCQDHTALPSASAPFVKGASASTASRSNVRDDGQRPSPGAGWCVYRLICDFGKSEYFCRRGLTEGSENKQVICPAGSHTPAGGARWLAPRSNPVTSRHHCEPTGRRKAPPDDKLREAIHSATKGRMDCFVAIAPRNDGD